MEWTAGEPRYQHTVRWAPSLIFSGLAGLVASIPMGLAMIFFNRVVSKGRAAPEPPKQITKEMAERAGVDELVPPVANGAFQRGLGTWGMGQQPRRSTRSQRIGYHCPLWSAECSSRCSYGLVVI